MRPVRETLSRPFGSLARTSVPRVSVSAQCLACASLSFAFGARQLLPWRSPAALRVILIFTVAAADNVKRKLVPSGAFPAEIAVLALATRKRPLVMLAAVIAGGGGVIEGVINGGVSAWTV